MRKNRYDKLYLSILRIGRDNAATGISYTTLQDLLIKEGYTFKNTHIDIAVKRWFYEGFHHIGIDDSPCTEYIHLDNHLHCKFIITGDACLKLLDYENGIRNTWFSFLAVFFGFLAIAITVQKDVLEAVIKYDKEHNQKELLQDLKQLENTNKSFSTTKNGTESFQTDSLGDTLYHPEAHKVGDH